MKPLEEIFYTDDWVIYQKIIPSKKHKIGKRYTIVAKQNNSKYKFFPKSNNKENKVFKFNLA